MVVRVAIDLTLPEPPAGSRIKFAGGAQGMRPISLSVFSATFSALEALGCPQ